MTSSGSLVHGDSGEGVTGGWRVLLAAEGRVDRTLVAGLLAKQGHQVTVAENGQEALQTCSTRPFDVILLDTWLCDMDTAEVVRRLRDGQAAHGTSPLILVMTDDEECRGKCRQAGADGFLSKPPRLEDLAKRVAAAQKQPGQVDRGETCGEDEIDWSVALAAAGGRPELVAELVELFFAEYPETVEQIRVAIERQDAKGLQLSAHKLKGCLRYFGSSHAGELARRLEYAARAQTLEGAHETFGEMTRAIDRLLPALSEKLRK